MNNENKIAYCGLFCGSCDLYLANRRGNIGQLSEETRIPVDLLACEGCRSDVVSLYCRNCAMKKCCLKKGIFACNECEEFLCSVLKAFESDRHPHHKGVIKALSLLNEIGKNEWIAQKEGENQCPSCGEPFSWRETTCSNCGKACN